MKRKIALVVCSILFIYFIGGVVYSFIRKENVFIKHVDNKETIKGFNYVLLDKDLDIYKSEFKKLKTNLESKDINYKDYAESISKMFIIDLYSLNEKENMYDIGGSEFIYPDNVENYNLNVENTLYKYMEDKNNGKRTQELPTVKNVVINSNEETKYKIGDTEYDGYKINLDIEYIKDLEYDKSAEITLIKKDKYLYIVEKV